jgi:hypothetical protein
VNKTNNILLDINLRIKETSYKKLKSIKVWYKNTVEPKTNNKELLNYIIDEFIKYKQLGYIDNCDVKKELKESKPWLHSLRIDNNFDPSMLERIDAIKEFFENKNDKKTTNEIIDYCLSLLFDLYPEINEILDRNKLIKQKDMIEKGIKKSQITAQKSMVL